MCIHIKLGAGQDKEKLISQNRAIAIPQTKGKENNS